MSRFSEMRGLRNQFIGSNKQRVELRGMQALDLIARHNHPVWDVIEQQSRQSATIESQPGQAEEGTDTTFTLEAANAPKVLRALGEASLQVPEQCVPVYEVDSERASS